MKKNFFIELWTVQMTNIRLRFNVSKYSEWNEHTIATKKKLFFD